MTQAPTFGFTELKPKAAPTPEEIAEFDAETEALRAALIQQSHDEGYGFLPPEAAAPAPRARREVPIERSPAPTARPAPAPATPSVSSQGLHPSFGHALSLMAVRNPSPAFAFAQAAQDGLILIEVNGAANRDLNNPRQLTAEEAVFGAFYSIIAAVLHTGALTSDQLEALFYRAGAHAETVQEEERNPPTGPSADMIELARAARMGMGFMPAEEAAELRARLEAMGL